MSDFTVADLVPESIQEKLASYTPLLQQLLYRRGITNPADAAQFLAPEYDTDLYDPNLLPDITRAVERLQQAITQHETIVIFADYDCDGIPGAVVLHDFLVAAGHVNFHVVIPHRHYDGFGLSVAQVEHCREAYHPHVVVTIDCGTTDEDAIAYANECGIDVVVTDHHEPPETLPPAVAIVNPKCGSYPFPDLCGAAVVFKLVQAMLVRERYGIGPGQEKWWLDMVGLATVADMVPLRGENRVLAYYGLQVLRKSRRPGLQELLRTQRTAQPFLGEDEIGFVIAPRVNAASRMDTPEDAFWLLASQDPAEAHSYVSHLERLNQDRKTAVAQMSKELLHRVSLETELPAVLVFGNPEWRPSLVGLAANKLAERYGRPVFLWGRDGNEQYKGSCRSDGSTSVVRLMEVAQEVFVVHGGHHFSGGFTVASDRIHELGVWLNRAYESLGETSKVSTTKMADAACHPDEIDTQFVREQLRCAPFGYENPKPLYLISPIVPRHIEKFGKTKEHTKITFSTRGVVSEAIAFFALPESFTVHPTVGDAVALLAHVEESHFRGRKEVRLRLIDIVPVR
jgi:single-stranded-DNA-specific exonuclease